MRQSKSYCIGFLFACLSFAITIYLGWTLNDTPLTEWATWDIQWSNNWLWMSTLDYYGAAACLSAIVIATESQLRGMLWTVSFLLLGSPMCCIYVAYRCFFFKSIGLRSDTGDGMQEEIRRWGRYSSTAQDERSTNL